MPADLDVELDPPGGEGAQQMAVGEQQHVLRRLAQVRDERVDARRDVRGALAARTAVAPQIPARALLADLRRGAALVLAVVPLEQLVARLRDAAVAGDPARLDGA